MLYVTQVLGVKRTSSVPLMTNCHSLTVVCQWYCRMPPGAKYTSAPVKPVDMGKLVESAILNQPPAVSTCMQHESALASV